jgi:hypothetical protein
MRRLGQLTLQNPKRVDEGKSVRILASHDRRVVHHATHYVVSQHQAVNLLDHPRRCLAPDRHRPGAEVGLDFVKGEFFFPSLVIDQRRLVRRHIVGVGQVGDQPMSFARTRAVEIVVSVLDDPNPKAAHVAAAVGRAGLDLGQIGAVGEAMDRP